MSTRMKIRRRKPKANERVYLAELEFAAQIKVVAGSEREARAICEQMLDFYSVYSDADVEDLRGGSYYAGGAGKDIPMRGKNVYEMRNREFKPKVRGIVELSSE